VRNTGCARDLEATYRRVFRQKRTSRSKTLSHPLLDLLHADACRSCSEKANDKPLSEPKAILARARIEGQAQRQPGPVLNVACSTTGKQNVVCKKKRDVPLSVLAV
jgi:hypothetical protein